MTAVWVGAAAVLAVYALIAASVVVTERQYLRRSGGAR